MHDGAVEVRTCCNAIEVDANLRVDVRKLQDNQMWIGNRSTSSPSSYSDDSSDPSKRHRNKKHPMPISCGDHQKSPWHDAEMKRKCRVARYELYASRDRLNSLGCYSLLQALEGTSTDHHPLCENAFW